MNILSVVIITRNEENNIADCIQSARLISNDIIVVDSGSEDNTISLAEQYGAKVFSITWMGYGHSRNYGAAQAKNNWILALDADERMDQTLALSIRSLRFDNDNCIYRFRRKNYLGKREIRFGALGFETVKRIYHRDHAKWDLTQVHEKLVSPHSKKAIIAGHIRHYGLKNAEDYKAKAVSYALMSAEKYFFQGYETSFLKRMASPLFNSLKSYVFQLGFLDGRLGFTVARTIAYYSWLKYFYLDQMLAENKRKELSLSPKPQLENFRIIFFGKK